jgi:hypothetical protein
VVSELHLTYPTAAEQLRRSHLIEWAEGWQYARTYRIVRGLNDETRPAAMAEAPAELLLPPDGERWERNVDCGTDGWDVVVPAWCNDGTAVLQRVHWRRPGWSRQPWHRDSHLSIARPDVHL